MLATYLVYGIKAGLIAGLVFGLFVAVVANPLVAYADEMNHAGADGDETGATEEASAHGHDAGEDHSHDADGEHGHDADGGHGHDGQGGHDDTAVSMAVNKTVSVIASGLWAVVLGGVVFGAGYYFLEPAIPGTGATKSYVLGGAGFVTVSGAPWLVLPPASPGAQQSVPVETRLLLYGGMMVAGALACLLAGIVYNRVRGSNGRAIATVAAVLPFGLLAIPAVLAPTNAVQGALAPDLRAGLIGLIVFGQVLVWLLLAAMHAQLRPTTDSHADRSPSNADSAVAAD